MVPSGIRSLISSISAKRSMIGTSISALHTWIAEAVPLLHQVNSQHFGQWIGRAASFFACFCIAWLDRAQKGLPCDYQLNFGQELLAFGPLICCGLIVIGETKLLASH